MQRVNASGHGTGFSEDSSLREQREGRLRAVEEPFYELFGPISFGDSGGPLVHLESGGALGVVSSYCSPFGVVDGVAACVVYGPTITHVLAEADSAGFPLRMRSAGESAPALSAPPPPSPAQPAGTPTPAPAPDSRPAPTGKRKSKSRAARRAACRRSARRLMGAKRKRALRRCARLR